MAKKTTDMSQEELSQGTTSQSLEILQQSLLVRFADARLVNQNAPLGYKLKKVVFHQMTEVLDRGKVMAIGPSQVEILITGLHVYVKEYNGTKIQLIYPAQIASIQYVDS